jgi:TPR repeat protein
MGMRKLAAPLACVMAICGGTAFWAWREETTKLAASRQAWRSRAELGDVKAQAHLASMYYRGTGVPQDFSEALRWYRKAADQGLAEAQVHIASMYRQGQGVRQSYAEALRWYREAAEQGNAAAESDLGSMYRSGLGTQQDYAEALRWQRKAADQGYANAECLLGLSYLLGQGVARHDTEAFYWMRKAAEHGLAPAQRGLGMMYYKGQGVPKDYGEAIRWYKKAADQGDSQAERFLDSMSSRPVFGRRQYVFLSIGLLASLWLSLEFMLPGKSLRDLRQILSTVVGTSGLALVGVALYAMRHPARYRYLPLGSNTSDWDLGCRIHLPTPHSEEKEPGDGRDVT